MDALGIATLVVLVLAVLGVAAAAFGVDSRESMDDGRLPVRHAI